MIRKITFLFLFPVAFLMVMSCHALPLQEHIDYGAEWKMVIEPLSGSRKDVVITNSDCSEPPVIKGNSFFYENVGGYDIDLQISYAESKDVRGALEISALISNNEEGWMVKVWEYPAMKGFKVEKDDAVLYPSGSGIRLPLKYLTELHQENADVRDQAKPWIWDAKSGKYEFKKTYPSKYCSMQWGMLQGKKRCVYFASHDQTSSVKDVTASYDPASEEVSFSFTSKMTCFAGETAAVPPVVVKEYEGSWYEGADTYRKWYLSNPEHHELEKPEWLQNNTGWLLAILKQQNDEVIVPYEEIGGMLTDAALERGLDVLGLFGRGIGGHDRFYPDYSPDPKLGGEKALRDGIAKAKERGVRVVLYTNGQLLDQDCSWFWPDTGKFITVQRENGKLEAQVWHKYHDAPPRVLGLACHSCAIWREMMLRLAKDANDLGADGLLYDQLACTPPKFCYSHDHGHSVPAITYEKDMRENMIWVREQMRKINPEFVVMTEGIVDAQVAFIDMFHGSKPAIQIPEKSDYLQRFDGGRINEPFDEMFSYTFPEAIMIARMRSPAHSRYSLNYGLAYGTRNEMELRYAGDRKYVERNEFPTVEDYANVTGAPSVAQIKEAGEPLESEKYYKQVLTFQKEHADLLMNGCFRAGNGVELEASSEYVMANAFESQDGKVGILVWNISDEPVTYKVTYPGFVAKNIVAPDKESVNMGDTLDPESVHLVLFERE